MLARVISALFIPLFAYRTMFVAYIKYHVEWSMPTLVKQWMRNSHIWKRRYVLKTRVSTTEFCGRATPAKLLPSLSNYISNYFPPNSREKKEKKNVCENKSTTQKTVCCLWLKFKAYIPLNTLGT